MSLRAAMHTTLSKKDRGPWREEQKTPLATAKVINTPDVSLKQAAEYTWHIWVAG